MSLNVRRSERLVQTQARVVKAKVLMGHFPNHLQRSGRTVTLGQLNKTIHIQKVLLQLGLSTFGSCIRQDERVVDLVNFYFIEARYLQVLPDLFAGEVSKAMASLLIAMDHFAKPPRHGLIFLEIMKRDAPTRPQNSERFTASFKSLVGRDV